jgi:hypothetical protein
MKADDAFRRVPLVFHRLRFMAKPATISNHLSYSLYDQADRSSGFNLSVVGADEGHTYLQPLSKFLR